MPELTIEIRVEFLVITFDLLLVIRYFNEFNIYKNFRWLD